METLTIFTPTYNRAKFLPRAFEALKRQTLKDFLWMIIDDGSTDNTEEVVQDLLKDTEAGFKIEYVKKQASIAKGIAIANIFTTISPFIYSDPATMFKILSPSKNNPTAIGNVNIIK